MSLLQPDALPLLLAVPLAALSFWALERARARRLVRTVGTRAPSLAQGRRRRWPLFAAGLLLALVALLQPAWGEATRAVEVRGVDILVCLDVSRSMLAQDLQPSRLARAQEEIRALAARAESDRVGLVLFAGDARLAVPLTRDKDSFAALASRASPLSVERGGSDLGAALDTALGALTGAHEVILLLTDGEDLEARGLQAARRCRDRGITVHCVGFGSARGAKIPDGEGFLRDRAGVEVLSTMDPARLQRITKSTGGAFVRAEPGALVALYEEHVVPMARKAFDAQERRERPNRFQWPLLAAFLIFLGERRR